MATKMRMRAIFDCSADDQGEISFKQGDVLVDVEKSSEDGWFFGRIENTTERGLFPYNYVERISSVEAEEQKTNLPGFPSLDAFEIAMSNSKTKSSVTKPSMPPVISSPKPKIAVKKINTPPPISEKPTVSRVRSYSTSATTTTNNKPGPTPVRPSQLSNGSTKSALELALSKGPQPPSSNLRSNSFSSKQTNASSVPLVGMANLKHSINNTDVEEEDGYQMIKPSQIRQKQPLKPINSISTTSSNPVAWKKVAEKPIAKLDIPVSSNPMPRLPSRPVSTANRRSRNSRSTSTSTNTLNKPSTLPAVKETEKVAPPILKPKPVLSQPHLPPRPSTKSRSTSNPPPIQPKPAMSSIEILLSKNAEKKSSNEHLSKVQPPPVSNKPNFVPKQQASKSTLIGLSSIPSFAASRPSLDNRRSNESDTDANIKPSTLLNRARSQTNPTNNSPVDWASMLTKPKSSSVIKLDNSHEKPIKKSIPPPPPPSRQPKSKQMDQELKHRYEILFETIQDDGYVDAETARFIWLKSKLSIEDLSRIWKECDVEHKGLLDKQSFMDGMTRIDRLLLNKQVVLS
ncbi:hypothetical protein BDF21DRAFT_148064 [Thamnidium elegans]|nr:hypothetical protein BDF21DRAFT_148064 [Thamnidium elegans]